MKRYGCIYKSEQDDRLSKMEERLIEVLDILSELENRIYYEDLENIFSDLIPKIDLIISKEF